MSLLPEIALHRMLVNGFKKLQSNPTIIDQTLKSFDLQIIEDVKRFIASDRVNICINYPRADTTLPVICIVLGSEGEEKTFIGDYKKEIHASDPPVTGIRLSATQSIPVLGGTATVAQPGGYTDSRLPEENEIIGFPPDMSEKTGRVFGAQFRATYNISIMSDNGTLTTSLYHLVRLIVMTSKTFLDENNIQDVQISGSDFTLQSEHTPDIILGRTLGLNFLYDFSYFVSAEQFTGFTIAVNEEQV